MKPWRIGLWLVFGLALGALLLLGQESATEQLINEILFRSQAYDILRELSDELGARLSTIAACERAVAFAEEHFRRAGTVNVHREPFTMLGWEAEALTAEVVEANRQLHLIAYVDTPSVETTASVVDLGEGSAEDFTRYQGQLAGKILLVGRGEAPRTLEEYLASFLAVPGIVARAKAVGAAALLLVHFQPGQTLYQTVALFGELAPLAVFGLSREDGLWLRRRLAAGKESTVRLRALNRIRGQATSYNVVAEVRGTEWPEEIVVVGAHLDSIGLGAGALDNGAGTAAVLDLAGIIAQQPLRRTVRFVLFTGEEEGCVGASAYMRAHAGELDQIVAMVNMDTGAGRVIAYENTGRPDVGARLEALVEKLGPLGPKEVKPGQTWYSDHGPFVRAGVPAFFLLQETASYETYIHTAADTFDKVNPADYRAAQAVLAATVAEIANAAERFARRWSREEMAALLEATGESKNLEIFGIPIWPLN